MDLDEIVFELESVESVLNIFSCLCMDAQIKDVAIISSEYQEKIQNIIKQLKAQIQK